jgi:hypothetical protein
MQQDKNFTVRLKAAIEKRMREAGVIEFGIMPPTQYDSRKKQKLWAFMQSLETITLSQLQGETK